MKRCSEKKNFCDMCCEFHIGISYPAKRVDCKKKCKSRIKGKSISLKSNKNLSNKSSKIGKKRGLIRNKGVRKN